MEIKVKYMDPWVSLQIQKPGVRLTADYVFWLKVRGTLMVFRAGHEHWNALYDGSSIPPILSVCLGQKLGWANACTGTVHDCMWDGAVEVLLQGVWHPVWFSPSEADSFYMEGHQFLGRKTVAVFDWLGVRAGSLWDSFTGMFKDKGPAFCTWEGFRQRYPSGVAFNSL